MSQLNRPLLTLSVKLTAARAAFRAVKVTGAASAQASGADGFTRAAGAVGEVVPVVVIGTATAEASGAIAAGADLEATADGRVATKTGGGALVAKALEAAAAAGDKIEVLVK